MIVPMKRLTLVGLMADEERILSALQSISAVQIISSGESAKDDALLSKLENEVQRLDSAQALLKPFAQKAKLGPKPEFSAAQLNSALPEALELCSGVEKLDHEISAAKSESDKRAALIEALKPWAEMTDGIETIKSTASVRCITGMMPPEGMAALADAPAAVQIFGGEKEKAVLLACHEENWAEFSAQLRTSGFQEFTFPALKGTPAQNIASLTSEVAALNAQHAELQSKLASLGEKRPDICRALDAAVIARDREASKGELGATATTFILDGWVRSDEQDAIRRALDEVTDTYYADFTDPAEDDAVPTVLKNSKLVEPYVAVTNLYSLPAANSVDGTPLMAPFYFIFFGMMLSDTGYGIVLALGCYLFLKLTKPDGMMRQLAGVLYMGGISTIVMGLLFGCFFGVSWPVIFKGLPFENTFPLIDSSAEPISMLALCAGMGIVHMFFGVCIATWRCIKNGDWVAAIGDNFAWLTVVAGLLMLAAPMLGFPAVLATIGKWMAIVSGVILFLAGGRSSKSIGGKIASGAFNCYNITGWLGDVLSYARVFALGLSTGVIGLVLNTLGGMLYSAFQHGMILKGIGFLLTGVLLVFLHGFMMAISTLGTFVHTARLQYVEFFGKFYESGGKPFKPLSYKTKHVRVTDR